MQQETARLEERIGELRDWTGPAGMQFVTSARRRDAGPSEIVLRDGEPYFVLGIDVGIPEGLSDSESLSVTIVDSQGTVPVEVEMTVGEARRQIKATAVITLVVSSSSLSPDSYEMRVSAPDREDMEPFLEAGLQVSDSN